MESIALLFFLLHQFGMALGLGAATFSLLFAISGSKDATFDASELRFIRLVDIALYISLFLIIATGAIITAAHVLAGETAVVGMPPFLFKWFLLVMVLLLAVVAGIFKSSKVEVAAISGATWYTLFVVHTTALAVGFPLLFGFYALMLVVFGGGFMVVSQMQARGEVLEVPGTPHVQQSAPRYVPPQMPQRPVAPPPMPQPQRPIVPPPQQPVIPPVHVMPQTPPPAVSVEKHTDPLTTPVPVQAASMDFTLPSEGTPQQ